VPNIKQADPKINTTCACHPEPGNSHLPHAIIVKMKATKGQKSTAQLTARASHREQTVGHIPYFMAEVLYQPLVDENIYITCKISRSLDLGRRLEIPLMYDVFVKREQAELERSLKEKLCSLKRHADHGYSFVFYCT